MSNERRASCERRASKWRTVNSGATSGVARNRGLPGRAQQADGADRNRGAVDRTTRSLRQHIGEPLGSQQRAAKRRAAGNERRPEEHESGQRATFHEQRSGERRVASDERRVASNGDEHRGGERRTAGDAATRDVLTSGVVAGCGRRATSSVAQHGGSLGRAQQADGADRNRGAVDRTTRSGRQHIGKPLGRGKTGDGTTATGNV